MNYIQEVQAARHAKDFSKQVMKFITVVFLSYTIITYILLCHVILTVNG